MNEARKLLRRIVIKWLIQAHLGPNGSQALTGPHSNSLDRDRAADIYDPNTAHNLSREDC